MVLSVIKFGIKQTEAVAVGAVRLGLTLARTLIDAVVDAPAPSRPQEPASPGPGQRSRRAKPAPTSQPAATAEPAERPDAATEPSRDPERERRIALRDEPSENSERSPHHMLNNPVTDDPDPTEWPDPYDQREDPRDPASDGIVLPGEVPHPPTGSTSTSSPHPSQDPQAERWNGPKAPDSPR